MAQLGLHSSLPCHSRFLLLVTPAAMSFLYAAVSCPGHWIKLNRTDMPEKANFIPRQTLQSLFREAFEGGKHYSRRNWRFSWSLWRNAGKLEAQRDKQLLFPFVFILIFVLEQSVVYYPMVCIPSPWWCLPQSQNVKWDSLSTADVLLEAGGAAVREGDASAEPMTKGCCVCCLPWPSRESRWGAAHSRSEIHNKGDSRQRRGEHSWAWRDELGWSSRRDVVGRVHCGQSHSLSWEQVLVLGRWTHNNVFWRQQMLESYYYLSWCKIYISLG